MASKTIISAPVLKNALADIPKKHLDLIFAKNNKALLKTIIDKINTAGAQISPRPENIFRAFKLVDDIKIVLIGQDPYPNVADATGLSFSVPFERRTIPPSLKNIYKCLQHNHFIDKMPLHGCLEYWAQQNVLLLNMALTTVRGKSNAHTFWNEFVTNIIKKIDEREAVVFILWGGFAQGCADVIKNGHILKWGHPSPLNSKNRDSDNKENFIYCDSFKRCNLITPIDWNINNGDIWAATDGSATKNGKKDCRAGWGFIMKTYDSDKLDIEKCGEVKPVDLAGKVFKSSNNRGELTAMIEMARAVFNMPGFFRKEAMQERTPLLGFPESPPRYVRLNIITDSRYTIGALPDFVKRTTTTMPKHQNNKENSDLIDELNELFEKLNGKITMFVYHVESHKPAPSNKKSVAYFKWDLQDKSDKLATSIFK